LAVATAIAMLLTLAGCGIARSRPDVAPASGTRTVLLLGDELLAQTAPTLPGSLAFFGLPARVVDGTTPGAGLLDPGIMDRLTAQLDANADADIVVIEFLGDCAQCPVEPGSAAYFDGWMAAAHQLVDAIRARGMTPVWVVAPPIDPVLPNAAMLQTLSSAGLAFAQANNVVVANWADAFTDLLGQYLPLLFYANLFEEPTWHLVRSDGVQFSDDGILRAANWIAVAIRDAWDAPPEPLPAGPPTTLAVFASPHLFPAFSTAVTDYVIRCTSDPVAVTIGAPDGTTVSVAGQPPASGWFNATVSRSTGQEFTLVVQVAAQAPATYFVRCLPPDFPEWTVNRTGTPQAEYYVTTPLGDDAAGNYPVIFDNDGVPIWWGPKTQTLFTELLPDGNVAWTSSIAGPAEERRLDGSLVSSITTSAGPPDAHDLLRLDNGNYVMVANVQRPNVDFSSWGPSGPGTAELVDQVIEELTPAGDVVWSWDTADHIPVAETDPQFRRGAGLPAYDAYHWNSIEATDTGYIVSFRHLDAVYNIDKTTGHIVWKLGGSTRPESLSIANDPVFTGGSHFGGQHDARLLGDGSVTLFDDGTNLGRAPRGVRYQIDTDSATATMVEQHTDPIAPAAVCCGSARRLDGGDWVIGWGGLHSVSELSSTDNRVFLLEFTNADIYRATPVAPGVLDRAALRAGMDAQYPL
jgi:hypothetical protein